MSFDNTNTGVLFANAERKTDKHPNARGTINIEGVEYWLSAWTKTGKNGGKYQSLSVQRKEPKPEQAVASEPEPFNDDIPF
jgi:uncharacterized protein (DUF736 family)